MVGGIRASVTVVCLCWFLASSLSVYPHSLSYFNESIGGPRNGSTYLIDSNFDWGQDLLYAQKWARHSLAGEEPFVAYFGTRGMMPQVIKHQVPVRTAGTGWPPGLYLVSATLLHGYPWRGERPSTGEPRLFYSDDPFDDFRSASPTGRIAYSIFVFDQRLGSVATKKEGDANLLEVID